MNESQIRPISPMLQLELDTLRDQRDLYHSLLLAEPGALAAFMSQALETIERLRSTLRTPTRDSDAFRGKIERLQAELNTIAEASIGLHLPTVTMRLETAQASLQEVAALPAATGNDLLPGMVALEDLCSHLAVAADCASVHVPLHEDAAEDIDTTVHRAQPKLAAALQQLVDKFAIESGKRVSLVTMGIEEIPDDWYSTLFDALGQLLRNAVEHGVEKPAERVARGKPDGGTIVVEFADRAGQGYELNVHDDGGGLNAERIAEVAVRRGLLTVGSAQAIDSPRLASLIFQPGMTTAADSARRGHGMQIVRDHVHRLGGKIQVATKRHHFTRFRISLPSQDLQHLSTSVRS